MYEHFLGEEKMFDRAVMKSINRYSDNKEGILTRSLAPISFILKYFIVDLFKGWNYPLKIGSSSVDFTVAYRRVQSLKKKQLE